MTQRSPEAGGSAGPTRQKACASGGPVLDYASSPKPSPVNRATRLAGAVCCVLAVAAGLVIIWVGGDGLWYAATQAPVFDRDGDLFEAGVVTAIGLVVLISSARWLRDAVGRRGEKAA